MSPSLFNAFSRVDRPSRSFRLCKQVNEFDRIDLSTGEILGSLLGRRASQTLDVNREYLVFLEPFFDGTYRPADFEDMIYSSEMNGLLEKTCGLSRTYPYTEGNNSEAALMNKCPSAVSVGCSSSKLNLNFGGLNYSTPTEASTTTITEVPSSILTPTETDPLDLEALSLLLADDPQEKLSSDFSTGANHKSLFSDDNTRTNQATQLSDILFINLVLLGILHFVS